MPAIIRKNEKYIEASNNIELKTWPQLRAILISDYTKMLPSDSRFTIESFVDQSKHLYHYKEERCNATFITVNSDPSVKLETLICFADAITRSIQSTKWILECNFVIEQRGTNKDDLGKGLHIHILAKLADRKYPSDLKKQIQHYIKKFKIIDEKNLKNYRIYNSIKVNSKAIYDLKMNYLLGLKKEDKLEKSAMDLLFRKANNLDDIYKIV